MAEHVLIAGVSTRAAAESAARAGYRVTAIDAFGDLDQHPDVRALSVVRDFGLPATASATARAARTVECDAVAYLSSFENHSRAVKALAAGRALWGNPPDVLRRVRDPLVLAATLRRRGFAVPEVRSGRSDRSGRSPDEWMLKPLRSGGGHHVRPSDGNTVPRGSYLQERIDGMPGSVVFAAAGGRAVPLGVSRQLIGDAAFGASGYRYCGNIVAAADDLQFTEGTALVERAGALARALAAEFGLVGANGVDFIAREGVPIPIEVNPRWSASAELVERLFGLSVFGAHADACAHGVLPEFDLARALTSCRAIGKAVVFARTDVTIGDTRAWLADPTVRDVPHPGERFSAGQPICTVFATAPDAQTCYDALVRRAGRAYAELGITNKARP